jgi:hypothetical protein
MGIKPDLQQAPVVSFRPVQASAIVINRPNVQIPAPPPELQEIIMRAMMAGQQGAQPGGNGVPSMPMPTTSMPAMPMSSVAMAASLAPMQKADFSSAHQADDSRYENARSQDAGHSPASNMRAAKSASPFVPVQAIRAIAGDRPSQSSSSGKDVPAEPAPASRSQASSSPIPGLMKGALPLQAFTPKAEKVQNALPLVTPAQLTPASSLMTARAAPDTVQNFDTGQRPSAQPVVLVNRQSSLPDVQDKRLSARPSENGMRSSSSVSGNAGDRSAAHSAQGVSSNAVYAQNIGSMAFMPVEAIRAIGQEAPRQSPFVQVPFVTTEAKNAVTPVTPSSMMGAFAQPQMVMKAVEQSAIQHKTGVQLQREQKNTIEKTSFERQQMNRATSNAVNLDSNNLFVPVTAVSGFAGRASV